MSEEMEPVNPRPVRKGIRRGIYIVPSAFTIGNILCGFYVIVNSIKAGSAQTPEQAQLLFDHATKAVGIAWLLDGLDGRIARMTNATSEFGVELDSIADVITFGVGPAVLAFTWGYGGPHGFDRLAWGVSFFFLICGALRLARFNVMARAPRFNLPGNSPKLDKRYFVGLPIPAAAGMLASFVHFSPYPFFGYPANEARIYSIILLVGMALLAILMVSTFRYASFKDLGNKTNKPFIILPLLSVLAAGIWFYSEWVLLSVATLYVVHGPVMKLWSLIQRLLRFRPNAPEESLEKP